MAYQRKTRDVWVIEGNRGSVSEPRHSPYPIGYTLVGLGEYLSAQLAQSARTRNPKGVSIMDEQKYRIRLTVDPYHIEDGANAEPLPEPEDFYTEYPYTPNGDDPMPYAEYLRTYGDPDNYTGYTVDLERKCECCGAWSRVKTAVSFCTSYYYTDDPGEGTYTLEECKKLEEAKYLGLVDLYESLIAEIDEPEA